jgi:hypothetical protein
MNFALISKRKVTLDRSSASKRREAAFGIGVLLGHRRVMLAAISKLAGAASATPQPAAGTAHQSVGRSQGPVLSPAGCTQNGFENGLRFASARPEGVVS